MASEEFTPRPVGEWDPEFCGDLDLSIDTDGVWHYQGAILEKAALVRLFASVLKREGDQYYLVTPVEKVRIRVADVPFRIEQMTVNDPGPRQRIHFTTQVGERVPLDQDHPIVRVTHRSELGPRPYVRLREGIEAVLSRPVYYRLADHAVEHDGALGVWSAGVFFPL